MAAIQRDHARCDCGGTARVRATVSLWEFEWFCTCGRTGLVSWAHRSPPPMFKAGPAEPVTLPLFDEAR